MSNKVEYVYKDFKKMTKGEQSAFVQGSRAKETQTKKSLGFFVPQPQDNSNNKSNNKSNKK